MSDISAKHDGDNAYLFRPRGLDQALVYDVTLDNERQVIRMTGKELARDSILIRLDSMLTSELLLLNAVQ